MPQDPSRPEMANEINMSSGDRCDERKKMMEQPGPEGVAHESDDLLILGDQPTSYTKTPVSTTSQEDPVFVSYDEGGSTKDVSIDEFITTVRESQLESLDFSFMAADDEFGSSRWNRNYRLEVIEAVSTCESLKTLTIQNPLDVEEVEVLCENLVSHPMLATLQVVIVSAGTSGDRSEKEAMEIVSNMLKNNRTIKSLELRIFHGTEIGAASLGAMLSVNSTLETLVVGTIRGNLQTGVEFVLAPLTSHDGKPPLNKSLKTLSLNNWDFGQRGARAAAQLLRTNDSLTHLGLINVRFSGPSVCTILESLETNETLHTLDLRHSEGVGGDVVLAKMMDLLRANPCLKDIQLTGTPLERDGRAVQVKAQLEMNSRDYMAVVKGMRRVQPKFARVFLCGDGYSGKRLNQFFNKYFFHIHLKPINGPYATLHATFSATT
jgi:hypothetical protein